MIQSITLAAPRSAEGWSKSRSCDQASGHPAIGHESRALEYYRAEGTPLKWAASGVFRVDLTLARHRPDESGSPSALAE